MNAIEFEQFLIEHKACAPGKKWAKGKSLAETYTQLDNPSWLKWLLWQLGYQDKKLWVELAIIAAESVPQTTEEGRAAIAAAKSWIENPSEETRLAADRAAARVADAAAVVADAAARVAAAVVADAAARDAYSDVNKKICDLWRKHVGGQIK